MQSQLLKRMHAHPIHRNAQAVVPRGRIFEIPSRRTLPRLLSSASPSPVKNSTTGSFDGADFYPANDTNECGDDEVCLAEKEIIMESVRSMDVDGGQAELAVENVLYDTSTVSKAITLLHNYMVHHIAPTNAYLQLQLLFPLTSPMSFCSAHMAMSRESCGPKRRGYSPAAPRTHLKASSQN